MTDLVEKFREYDAANPHVWELFQRFAFEAISHGVRTLSTAFIIERIRWGAKKLLKLLLE